MEIKGYVRRLEKGVFSPGGQGMLSEVVVTGPDGAEWRYPVEISDIGSLHYRFDEATTATGLYDAAIYLDGKRCGGEVPFRKDAYRLPKFQVRLDAPKIDRAGQAPPASA